jgi:hypothetical protein
MLARKQILDLFYKLFHYEAKFLGAEAITAKSWHKFVLTAATQHHINNAHTRHRQDKLVPLIQTNLRDMC